MAPQENAVAAAAAPEAKSSEGAPQTEKKDEAGTQVAAAAETKPAETAASDTKTSDNKSPSPAEATKTGSNGQDCEDDGQKMVDRAKRFGLKIPEVEDEKKLDRAKRFGLPVPELDAEKKAERAKRFGTSAGVLSDKDRKAERAKRFAGGNATSDPDQDDKLEEKMKQRAARFGTEKEEDKMKARAERFATPQAAGADVSTEEGSKDAEDTEEERKRKRATRFSGSALVGDEEEDKRELRAQRFKPMASE